MKGKYLRSIAPLILLAWVALGVIAPGILSPGANVRAMGPAPPAAPAGSALVNGTVFLNGLAVSGPSVALAAGDRVETRRGSAIVTLSGRDSLVLGENSALALSARSGGLSAELSRGRLRVNSTHERLREVRLAGEGVSVRAAPGAPRRYDVMRVGETTYVVSRTGAVTIFDEGYATQVDVPEGRAAEVRQHAELLSPPAITGAGSVRRAAGDPVLLAQQRPPATPARPTPVPPPPAPQAGGGRAGQISAVIPKDYIQRGTQTLEGNRGDEIRWNDLVRTEDRGRVRIALDDGSILNVGSGSRLQVVQHDNRSQQTTLQLQFGRVRAQVVKLSQPGASFQIRTNTAVCGVLGTDFYVEADDRETRVVVFSGLVRVTPIAAAAAAAISVAAGQATSATSSAAAAPSAASAGQVQGAISGTQASAGAAGAAGTGAAAASATAGRVALLAAVPAVAVTAATAPVFRASPSGP